MLNSIPILFFRGQHRHFSNNLQHWDAISFSFFSSFISILFSSNLPLGPKHFQCGLSGEPVVQSKPLWLSTLCPKQHGCLTELPRLEWQWLQQAPEWCRLGYSTFRNLHAPEDSISDLRNPNSSLFAYQQQDGSLWWPAGVLPHLSVSVCHAGWQCCLQLLITTHVWWQPHATELLQCLLSPQSLQSLWIQFSYFSKASCQPRKTEHLSKHFTLFFSFQWGLWWEAVPAYRDGAQYAHDKPFAQ